jgi:mono/diheme cytochrome c family protein
MRTIAVSALAAVAVPVLLAGLWGPARAQEKEEGQGLLIELMGITPEDRKDEVVYGGKLVEHLGCLFCHGLGGREGIVNPNAERKYVPAWDDPEFAERYPTREKVRETIREGRFPDKADDATGNPIPMPPWGNRLSDGEVDAILAYIWSLRGTPVSSHPQGGQGADDARSAYLPPIHVTPEAPEPDTEDHMHEPPRTGDGALVKQGRSMVEYLGCLHCHGLGGREGMDNPNAERKTVPAWDDPEFIRRYPVDDGVRWVIVNGRMPERAPDATDDPVPMPPFGRMLSTEEMDAIVAYIWSLRDRPAEAGGHAQGQAGMAEHTH